MDFQTDKLIKEHKVLCENQDLKGVGIYDGMVALFNAKVALHVKQQERVLTLLSEEHQQEINSLKID